MASPTREDDDRVRQQRRVEYTARINRVLDHIEAHLDEPLRLRDLAAIAHLSPFHFHRVFGAMTGETVTRLVQRLRLEKAAGQLRSMPDEAGDRHRARLRLLRLVGLRARLPGGLRHEPQRRGAAPRRAGQQDGYVEQQRGVVAPQDGSERAPSSSWHIDAATGHLDVEDDDGRQDDSCDRGAGPSDAARRVRAPYRALPGKSRGVREPLREAVQVGGSPWPDGPSGHEPARRLPRRPRRDRRAPSCG